MCVACAGKHNYTDTRTPRSHWATGGNWLGYKDSNLNYLIQNQAYYRYTIPHCWSGADEEIRTLTRSPSLRPERSASASSATSAHATTSCTIHDAQGVCQSEFRGDAAPAMPVRRLCVCPLFQGAEEIQDGCGDGEFGIRFVLNVTVDTRLGVVVDELELEAFEDW